MRKEINVVEGIPCSPLLCLDFFRSIGLGDTTPPPSFNVLVLIPPPPLVAPLLPLGDLESLRGVNGSSSDDSPDDIPPTTPSLRRENRVNGLNTLSFFCSLPSDHDAAFVTFFSRPPGGLPPVPCCIRPPTIDKLLTDL